MQLHSTGQFRIARQQTSVLVGVQVMKAAAMVYTSPEDALTYCLVMQQGRSAQFLRTGVERLQAVQHFYSSVKEAGKLDDSKWTPNERRLTDRAPVQLLKYHCFVLSGGVVPFTSCCSQATRLQCNSCFHVQQVRSWNEISGTRQNSTLLLLQSRGHCCSEHGGASVQAL